MKINIDDLTEPELIDLNRRIVERLRLFHQVRAHVAMLEFKIGDRVAFQVDPFHTMEGMLTRYNRKTVTVISDDGRRWTVSPSLLRHATSRNAEPDVKNVTPRARALETVLQDEFGS
jgi:ribosomal protein L21E